MNNNEENLGTVIIDTWKDGVYLGRTVSKPRRLTDEEINQLEGNLGIGLINPFYVNVNEIQDANDEYKKISKFLKKYILYYSEKNNVSNEDLHIQFINYGKTELVYVLTEKNGKQITLLVKQPAVKFGKVKQEADYLSELYKVDKNVIAPIDYFEFGDQELYATPYLKQARCIASSDSWGMYIPEPHYRFEPFTRQQESVVNSCMIAKLISLFNFDKQQGICSCKLGGGDFILPKDWEKKTPSIENTLENMYLIAAREKIHCSFHDYLQTIRKEFSKRTIELNQNDLIINLRGRVPMKIEDIEAGIELGKTIIKSKI